MSCMPLMKSCCFIFNGSKIGGGAQLERGPQLETKAAMMLLFKSVEQNDSNQ